MKKSKKFNLILILSFLIILGIGLIVLLNVSFFKDLISDSIQKYGLLAVLFFSFLVDILFQPIGPEVPALVGVVLNLNVYGVILIAIIGSILGSLFSFYVGKKYFLGDSGMICSELDSSGVCKAFNKYGKWGLALASISPIPWVPFCWLSGLFKLRLRSFIFYGLIPRAIRIFVVVFGVDSILRIIGF